MARIWNRRGKYTVFVVINKDDIEMDFQDIRMGPWTGLIWLRLVTCSGHL